MTGDGAVTGGEAVTGSSGWAERTMRGDDGSVVPLLAAFTAIALALILVVGAAGSLYLDHKRLLAVADSAALAAAESFDLAGVSAADGGVVPALSVRQARMAAQAAVDADPTASARGMSLTAVDVTDGRSATVTVGAVWRPPWLSPFLPDGVAIDATSTARSVFR